MKNIPSGQAPFTWKKIPPEEFHPVPLIASFMICYPPMIPQYFKVYGIQLIYLVEGGISFVNRLGEVKMARAGDVVCFYPGVNYYHLLDYSPTSFYQIQFLPAGKNETERIPWLEDHGFLPNHIEKIADPKKIVEQIEKVITIMDKGKPLWESHCAAALLLILNICFESYYDIPDTGPARTGRWEQILMKLEKAPHDIAISKLAAREGMSTESFIRGFKKYAGVPPRRYLLQRRLWIARNMLFYSSSVKEVAVNLGFSDPLYFSRIYRKFFGYAPSETAARMNIAELSGNTRLPLGRHLLAPGIPIDQFVVPEEEIKLFRKKLKN